DLYALNDNKNIVLELGGQEWSVAFLTTDNNGDVIVTLWMTKPLKNSSGDYVKNKYGWMTSTGSSSGVTIAENSATIISDAYSTSAVRVSSVNGGSATSTDPISYYTTATTTAEVDLETRQAHPLAAFTLDNSVLTGSAKENKSLINYITQPYDVEYTYCLEWSFANSVHNTSYFLNEALTRDRNGELVNKISMDGSTATTTFFGKSGNGSHTGKWWNAGIRNYASSVNNHYNDWGSDYVWVPSVSETGGSATSGLWGTGSTTTGQVLYTESSSNSLWARSGDMNDPAAARHITAAGVIGYSATSNVRSVRPALHFNLTKASQSKRIEVPQNISGLTYDGTNKWIDNLGNGTPAWVDLGIFDNTQYMTSAITYTDTSGVNKGTVTKEQVKNAGAYTVTMTLADGLLWADGDGTGTRQFTITIGKATPNVDPTFPGGRPFVTSGFPQPTSYTATCNGTDVAGTFDWINQNELIEVGKSKEYEWTFKPEDGNNYNSVTGKATFNFQERTIVSRTYAWKPEYSTIYTATTDSQLMDMIKLEVVYNDSPTPVIETNFEILGSTLVAGFGNSEVTVKFGSAIETITIPATVEVVEAAIENLTVIFVQSGKVITVETPLDELKNCLTVYVKWNYTDAQDEVNKADYTLSGTLAVSGSSVKVVYDGVEKPITNINVTKATYNMTAANAAASVAQEQVYNENTQAFAFDDSKLPGGVTVDTITYTNTADNTSSTTAPTNVGVYTVTISFNQANSSDYNKVADITSQLTVKQAKITGISFLPDVKSEITGVTYTLTATGVPEWVSVTYSATDEENEPLEGTEFGDAGKYYFTATFSHDNPNYEQLEPMTAMLTISDKPKVEGADDIVVEAAINVDYNGSPVDYSAKKVPEGVGVSYEILKDGKPFEGTEIIEVGEYTVTVIFDTGNDKAPIAEKTCVVTVSQGTYDMDGVELTGNRTVVYNGEAHGLTLSGTLPDGVEYTVKYYVDGEETTPIAVGTYDVVVSFTNPDPVNYKDIRNIEATLTISDAAITGISAAAEEGAAFTTVNTLDELKAKLTVTAVYENGTKETVTEFTLTCETLREGGLLEVGTQTVTVAYNDGVQEFETTVEIEVLRAKVALPVYKNTLSYTGGELKPTAADFEFNAELVNFVDDKTAAGTNAGVYKAVFALKD
ncbi:MAG: MBG domain-containing protein, partial [Clostridia bacterium]|nr:MBG domain-containing protein [Clostridia bacterium]